MKHKFKLTRLWVASLLLLFGFTTNAWAVTAHFNLIGDPVNGDWAAYSTAKPINSNYYNYQKYHVEVYISKNQYFALNNGSSRYAPKTQHTALNKDVEGMFGGYYADNSWQYTGTTGIVRVCVDQSAGDNGEWYPSVWVEKPDISLHHTWNKSDWTQEGPMTDKQDGTYTMDHNYSGSSNGYSYYGWYEGTHMSSGNGKLTRNPSTIAEGAKCQFLFNSNNMTLTITRYDKITYNANNATSGSVPSATEALYNTKATIAGNTGTLKRNGFSFAGWNTKSDGSGTTYASGDEYTMNGDVTLYAKWVVSLDVKAGTGISSVSGSAANIALNSEHQISATPKNGYYFGQWTASPAENASFSPNAQTANATVTVLNGSVTVTATGELETYNITYPDAEAQAAGHFTISNQTTSGQYTKSASFTATPAKGYRLKVTATYGSSQSVTLTHTDFSYSYSFTIPAGDVTINVTAYRYGLAYSLYDGNFDEQDVVLFDNNDQVVLSNLSANTKYKFKPYNAAYTSSTSSHFMGNENDWNIYDSKTERVVTCEGASCFVIYTGAAGDYVISLNDNVNNKPSIDITYPNVNKMNIDGHDYEWTLVSGTVYQTETFTLASKLANYAFNLYWEGARLGNDNPMDDGQHGGKHGHTGWEYKSTKRGTTNLYTTDVANGKYSFQFDASDKKLTAIYPSVIAGGFLGHSWDGAYTLTFDGNVGTVNIPLDASETQIGFKVVDDGQFYGKQGVNIISTTTVTGLTPSTESSYDMNFTPNIAGIYTFTYNRSDHSLTVTYPTSTQTYDVTVYADGITPTTVNVGSDPAEITAVEPQSMVFDKWVKEGETGNVTIASATSKSTTITATGASASVRAIFKTSGTAYIKNIIPEWDDMWLYFYDSKYWDTNKGSGSRNIAHKDCHAENIKNTDIWYYNYESHFTNWTSGIIAYANKQRDDENFSMVKCSYFDGETGYSKFDSRTPLFIPRDYITNLNTSQYYLEGIWMKYNSTESGFDLRGKNVNKTEQEDPSIIWNPSSDAQKHKFTAPTPGEYTFSTTLSLQGNAEYEMRIYDVADRWYSLNGNTMEATSCTDWRLYLKNNGNFHVKTTATGEYTFTISVANGEMRLTITYPLSDNDYRVVYNNGSADKDNGYIIKNVGTGEQKDTASFFIDGTTGNVRLQKCTDAATQTWVNVAGQSISLTNYSDGVYNFIVSQNGNTATLTAGGEYTGKFYIRTDGVDGGWESFKTSADNEMTNYGSLLDAGATYDNFQYDYYKTKWVHSGKNVKFRIANDYSKAISEDFAADAIINDKETLPQDANVRFMWNSETNLLKRAYISGSTNISDRFLVLEGDAKMFDKNGNALTDAGGGKISGLDDYELNFDDKNNWVYQADIKAQPGCAVKLTAKYNSQVQYFIGKAGEGTSSRRTIIDGTSESIKQYSMRAVYDFKTNRLTAGWIPDGTQIDDELKLGGDLLLVREGQGDVRQITFGVNEETHEPGKVTDIQHIYSVLTIKKDTMIGTTEKGYADRATNEDYAKTMYWVSFPFAVKVSEIFGVDGYGTKWIMQKYNGEKRAEIGWFTSQTSTFWEFIDESETLEAYKGYLFLINANYFNTSGADVWKNSATEANFYFPSTEDEIGIIKADTYDQPVPAHACGIDQEFTGKSGAMLNHKITDSYWNVIGVPAFQDAQAAATLADGCTLKSYYKWKSDDNTYEAKTTMDGMTFKTMHAYMVQFGGTLKWSNVSVVSNKAPYQYADNKNYRIELFFSNGEAEDHAYINLADGASTDFVLNEDMMKIDNAGFPNIYSFAGAYNVAYNETKMDNQSVMLGVSAPKNGTYTFAMPKDFSGKAILVDLESGEATDLNLSNYTVDLDKGTYNNRFQLVLEVEAKAPTAIDNAKGEWSEDGKTKKLLINDQIYLINAGRIYNVLGIGE